MYELQKTGQKTRNRKVLEKPSQNNQTQSSRSGTNSKFRTTQKNYHTGIEASAGKHLRTSQQVPVINQTYHQPSMVTYLKSQDNKIIPVTTVDLTHKSIKNLSMQFKNKFNDQSVASISKHIKRISDVRTSSGKKLAIKLPTQSTSQFKRNMYPITEASPTNHANMQDVLQNYHV